MSSRRPLLGPKGDLTPIRVLHVVASLGLQYGGVSTSVRELCRALAEIGLEVTLWTTQRGYDPSREMAGDRSLLESGVRLRYFPVHPWGLLGDRYAYSSSLGRNLQQEIPRMDLVHLHGVWQYPTAIAARICRKTKTPYLISPCGALDPSGFQRYKPFKRIYGFWIERRTLAAAVMIHFTSALEKNQAWSFGENRPGVVVPRCIRIEEIPESSSGSVRSRYPSLDQRRILLFLGRLHPIKRLDLLANAFAIVARRLSDVHLLLVGPDDGAGPQVRRILDRARLLDHVTFTGPLAGLDKWAALRDSALLLLPSKHENFGLAALEAMAVGTPVLVSPQVALAEHIERNGAGRVVKPDPSAWAHVMEQLLSDPEALRAMGEAGQRLVATEFNSQRIAQSMKELYLSILRDQRTGANGV